MVSIGDPAPNVRVLDTDGREVDLAAWWKRGPAVLAFLRHFG